MALYPFDLNIEIMMKLFPSTSTSPTTSNSKYPLYSNEEECYQQSLKLEPLSSSSSSSSTTTIPSGTVGTTAASYATVSGGLSSGGKGPSSSSSHHTPLVQRSNQIIRKSLQKIKSSRF